MTDRRVTQCTGHTKKGHGPRCKRRTSRTNLCWTHLQSEKGLKIKPSLIPGAGMGLFTTKPRRDREVVAPYTGRTYSRPNTDEGGEYAIQLTPDRRGPPFRYVNANRSTDGAGRYANDARSRRNNSRLRPEPNGTMARVVATRPIAEGKEVYAGYGDAYWGR